MSEDTKMTLGTGDHMSIRGDEYPADSLFKGLNVYIRNNGRNKVEIEASEDGLVLTIKTQ